MRGVDDEAVARPAAVGVLDNDSVAHLQQRGRACTHTGLRPLRLVLGLTLVRQRRRRLVEGDDADLVLKHVDAAVVSVEQDGGHRALVVPGDAQHVAERELCQRRAVHLLVHEQLHTVSFRQRRVVRVGGAFVDQADLVRLDVGNPPVGLDARDAALDNAGDAEHTRTLVTPQRLAVGRDILRELHAVVLLQHSPVGVDGQPSQIHVLLVKRDRLLLVARRDQQRVAPFPLVQLEHDAALPHTCRPPHLQPVVNSVRATGRHALRRRRGGRGRGRSLGRRSCLGWERRWQRRCRCPVHGGHLRERARFFADD